MNAKAKNGRTALMVAAEAGHFETVSKLLLAGADVNAKDKEGSTALRIAEVSGHRAIFHKDIYIEREDSASDVVSY